MKKKIILSTTLIAFIFGTNVLLANNNKNLEKSKKLISKTQKEWIQKNKEILNLKKEISKNNNKNLEKSKKLISKAQKEWIQKNKEVLNLKKEISKNKKKNKILIKKLKEKELKLLKYKKLMEKQKIEPSINRLKYNGDLFIGYKNNVKDVEDKLYPNSKKVEKEMKNNTKWYQIFK